MSQDGSVVVVPFTTGCMYVNLLELDIILQVHLIPSGGDSKMSGEEMLDSQRPVVAKDINKTFHSGT